MPALTKIKFGDISVELKPTPINPAWIIDGSPFAQSAVLSVSDDGTANTVVWDCTSGRFNWIYRIDETVYVLSGSVDIKDENGEVHRVVVGDSIFFPAGSRAEWMVADRVRKIAFLRTPFPRPLAFARRSLRQLKRWLKPGLTKSGPPMFGG